VTERDGRPQTGTKGETPDTAKGRPKVTSERTAPTAEGVEGRGQAEGNPPMRNMSRTQGRADMTSARARIGEAAGRDKKMRFTALLHHVYDVGTLREAYLGLKRQAAPGVDGQTWEVYGGNLEGNLQELSERLKRGAYRAQAVRRVFIPKADGRQRPLGVTSLEDKIVQRATVEVLNAIYEADFLGFSYGFRPGRRQHDALDALSVGLDRKKVNWVLDADIRGFFDTIDQGWLVKFVEHRVADRRVVRLIQKWLRAGVLEDGTWTRSEEGTPQGGAISPLLANIYLHYVFDLWAQDWRQRQATGDVIIVRYADDIVMGFETSSDAVRFRKELEERFSKFNLSLHPEKTRLLEFGRYAADRRARAGKGKPETFTFLGFTHACGKTRTGRFTVLRQTIGKRLRAKVREVKATLERRLHDPVPEVGAWLGSVVRGHINYYGVPGNTRSLDTFRHKVMRLWRWMLNRRSQRKRMTWERMRRLVGRWLPPVRVVHPYPGERLVLTT
jgi:RNA-directed DNA polymerase